MAVRRPFNLQQWIDENRDTLKPPVGNKNLYQEAGDYIVMIVAGPNARKDYHFNETEELFYQVEGDIKVKIREASGDYDAQNDVSSFKASGGGSSEGGEGKKKPAWAK